MNLSKIENEWLKCMFKPNFKDKNILMKQAKESLVTTLYDEGFISTQEERLS